MLTSCPPPADQRHLRDCEEAGRAIIGVVDGEDGAVAKGGQAVPDLQPDVEGAFSHKARWFQRKRVNTIPESGTGRSNPTT